MTSLANRLATKMNGCGNAILVLDLRGTQIEVSAAEARAIAASDGLAFDQLMALHDPRSSGSDAYMTIFNADGSQAGACGNGTRCVAWTLLRDGVRTALSLETAAGPLVCRRVGETAFEVEMGRPRFGWRDIPLAHDAGDPGGIDLVYGPDGAPILRNPAVVDMGNPHAVFFVEDIAAYNLAVIGQALERHPIFPARANISLARVVAPDLIELRTWERGAGLTLACGSAACAAAVTAARKGLSRRRARVSLPGGDLDILWRESDDMVLMTGPAEFEFETRLEPALFAGLAA